MAQLGSADFSDADPVPVPLEGGNRSNASGNDNQGLVNIEPERSDRDDHRCKRQRQLEEAPGPVQPHDAWSTWTRKYPPTRWPMSPSPMDSDSTEIRYSVRKRRDSSDGYRPVRASYAGARSSSRKARHSSRERNRFSDLFEQQFRSGLGSELDNKMIITASRSLNRPRDSLSYDPPPSRVHTRAFIRRPPGPRYTSSLGLHQNSSIHLSQESKGEQSPASSSESQQDPKLETKPQPKLTPRPRAGTMPFKRAGLVYHAGSGFSEVVSAETTAPCFHLALDPSQGSKDMSIRLDLDVEEDWEDNLESFCRLTRLGLIKEAKKHFWSSLGHLSTIPYIRVQYAEMLLSAGCYKELRNVMLPEFVLDPENETADDRSRSKLAANFALLDLLSQRPIPDYLEAVLRAVRNTFIALAADSLAGSTEVQLLTLCLRVLHRLELCTNQSITVSTKVYAKSLFNWRQIYRNLVGEACIWDFKDLFKAFISAFGWQDTAMQFFGTTHLPRVMDNLLKDWTRPFYDESFVMGLLDVLTSLILQDHSESMKARNLLLLHHAKAFADHVEHDHPNLLMTRPFVQWLLAKTFLEMERPPASTDEAQLNRLGILRLDQGSGISLPICVPFRHIPGPDWKRFLYGSGPAQRHAVEVAIRAADEIGDDSLRADAIKLLILQLENPNAWFVALAKLQADAQGDTEGHLATCLSSYLAPLIPEVDPVVSQHGVKHLQVDDGFRIEQCQNETLAVAWAAFQALLSRAPDNDASLATDGADPSSFLIERLSLDASRIPPYLAKFASTVLGLAVPTPMDPLSLDDLKPPNVETEHQAEPRSDDRLRSRSELGSRRHNRGTEHVVILDPPMDDGQPGPERPWHLDSNGPDPLTTADVQVDDWRKAWPVKPRPWFDEPDEHMGSRRGRIRRSQEPRAKGMRSRRRSEDEYDDWVDNGSTTLAPSLPDRSTRNPDTNLAEIGESSRPRTIVIRESRWDREGRSKDEARSSSNRRRNTKSAMFNKTGDITRKVKTASVMFDVDSDTTESSEPTTRGLRDNGKTKGSRDALATRKPIDAPPGPRSRPEAKALGNKVGLPVVPKASQPVASVEDADNDSAGPAASLPLDVKAETKPSSRSATSVEVIDDDGAGPAFYISLNTKVETNRGHGLATDSPRAASPNLTTPLVEGTSGKEVNAGVFVDLTPVPVEPAAKPDPKPTPQDASIVDELLLRAAQHEDTYLLCRLLKYIKDPASADAGYSDEHYVEILHAFLEDRKIGAPSLDIPSRDENGNTPLHRAAHRGDMVLLSVLCDLGGKDIGINSCNKAGNTPLHLAAQYGQVEAVSKLIADDDIQVNVQNKDGNTPLHLAVRNDNRQAIGKLLRHDGIDVNVQNGDGNTPLHLAIQNDEQEAIRTLIGCNKTDVNAQNMDGNTPLHLAARWGRAIAVRELLEHEYIKVNTPNKDGDTPMQLAVKSGYSDILAMLAEMPPAKESMVQITEPKQPPIPLSSGPNDVLGKGGQPTLHHGILPTWKAISDEELKATADEHQKGKPDKRHKGKLKEHKSQEKKRRSSMATHTTKKTEANMAEQAPGEVDTLANLSKRTTLGTEKQMTASLARQQTTTSPAWQPPTNLAR
ncbi:hypothetical protein VTJ83DRAFT_5932 [Remersonia thermophila]|uniref:Ankyrin repeat protein n=1 Tax=Remersonia thermophila TaxID=72144 RepID=A0ABR4D902_9PEZI